MAINHRNPRPDQTVIHSDHRSHYASWAFAQRAKDAGLLPSIGIIGDAYDDAGIESFWGRSKPDCSTVSRNTRIELANAIFEYLETFNNRRRRHTANFA
jgi:transposase InsO family protein